MNRQGAGGGEGAHDDATDLCPRPRRDPELATWLGNLDRDEKKVEAPETPGHR
jgi:hypothetical protein